MSDKPLFTLRKSIIAGIVEFFACFMGLVGIVGLIKERDVEGGISMLVVCFLLVIVSEIISERKNYKQMVEFLKSNGLLERLPDDVELCFDVYNSNRSRITLKFIEKYNPHAAEQIREALRRVIFGRKNSDNEKNDNEK
jgi:hypothetical protein